MSKMERDRSTSDHVEAPSASFFEEMEQFDLFKGEDFLMKHIWHNNH